MTARDCDDCRRCDTCPNTVCSYAWPPNTCDHGCVICEDCRPGDCAECSDELGDES